MRNAWKAVLLIAGVLAGSPATAQVLEGPPPTQYALDARGVDVVQGSFNYSTTEVVIGQPGQGGLSYIRTFMAGGWRDNLTGTLEELPGRRYAVSIGALTEIFKREVDGSFTPERDTGSTLVNGFFYTLADGTVAYFSPPVSSNPTNPAGIHAGRIFHIERPNGERIDFHYKDFRIGDAWDPEAPYVTRLQGVSNSSGYVLKMKYLLDAPTSPWDETAFFNLQEVMGINTAVDACYAWADVCTGLTRDWPKAVYGQTPGWETVTDNLGLTTAYQSNTNGILAIRHPGSTTDDVAVVYTSGRASSVTVNGSTWTYGYSDAGPVRTTTITDPLSNVSVATSSLTTGLLNLWRDAAFQTTGYVYDPQGRLVRTTLPEGDEVLLTRDARGNVIQTLSVPKPGSGLANIVTSATYPATCANRVTCNLPTSTTDARGGVTDYVWNGTHGGLESVTQPAPAPGAPRPQTRIVYASLQAETKNHLGVLVPTGYPVALPVSLSACATGTAPSCVGAAGEARTIITYGADGVANNLLPTSVATGDGSGALWAITATVWTPEGDPLTVDGPLAGTGDTTRYRYDAGRRPVGVIGPDPDGGGPLLNRAGRITYDARGLPTLMEQGTTPGQGDPAWAAFAALHRQATTYDAYRRPVAQALQDTAGTTHQLAQTSYDAAGRVDCVATRMNPLSFAAPPSSACTAAAVGVHGPDRILRHGYDAVGRLASTTSGHGSGSAITESVTYTANGLPRNLTDGRGNVSIVEYDGFDRLYRLRYPNAVGGGTSTTDYEQYGYDAASNVISHRTRAGQVFTSTYDALNRRTVLATPAGMETVAYAYDNLGRLLTASVPSQTTTLAWDALDRLVSETGPLGTMSYQYDLAGRRTRQTWPDGFFVTNAWNVAGDMTDIFHGGTTAIVSFAYDNLGRRTLIGRGNGVGSSYGYDSVGRLISLTHDVAGTAADVTFGYGYNAAGQIVTRTVSNPAYGWSPTAGTTPYATDGLNRVTTVNGAPVSYDANGNITNDTARTFTYDAASRLTGVNGGVSTISYDALGRLYDHVGAAGGRYLYDGVEAAGFAPVGSTALQNRFVRGPGVDEIVANFTTVGPTPAQYWAYDERGSLVNLSAGATGASTMVNTYDEYGRQAATNLGRFQYTGQLWLPDFGLYHYKARAYHPGLGRFVQTDPIGYGDGANLYAYVGADPINLIDPWGMQSFGIDDFCDRVTETPNCTARGDPVTRCHAGWTCMSPSDFWGGGWKPDNPFVGEQDRPLNPAGYQTCVTARSYSWDQHVGGLGLGVGDALTFGIWSKGWTSLPVIGEIYEGDIGSAGYELGVSIGTGLGAGRLLYAGIASGYSRLSGPVAAAARNNLKGIFSGYGSNHPRNYNYNQLIQRYGSDQSVASAASRTNPIINTYAVGVVATGISTNISC